MRTGILLGRFIQKAGEGASLATFGAANAAGNHTRSTTADASKGSWFKGGCEWNEALNALGIGCYDPQYNLDLGPTATMRFRGLANGILKVDALGVVGVYVPAPAPNAPTLLTLSNVTTNSITLNWTDNSSNETGFKIERSTDNFQSIVVAVATVGPNVITYLDSGLISSTTYYYRVRATNASGDSQNSNVANATTLAVVGVPAAPLNLVVSGATLSSLTLNWTDNSNNETGFKIERGPNVNTFAQVGTVGPNVATYLDTGLAASTTYFYRVRATNGAGDSAYSNTAQGTTLTPAGGVLDNFTGVALTSLASHTSDSGHTWTLVRGGWVLTDGFQYAGQSGGSTGLSIAWISGQGADGTVTCGLTSQVPGDYTTGTLPQNGLCFRYDAASDKCIVLIRIPSPPSYQLMEYDGINPGTVFGAFPGGEIGDVLKVKMLGSVWNVWLNTVANPTDVLVIANLTIAQSWTSTGHHGLANTWNHAFNNYEWFTYAYTP